MLCILQSVALSGQVLIEDEIVLSESSSHFQFGLPIKRKIFGGTKLIVDFQGAWTNEMKGAFDYACRICEEAMPTTFPIRIQAVLDKNKKTDTFSQVSISSHSHTNETLSYTPFSNVSPWTEIKGTKFDEMRGHSDTHVYDDIITEDMFSSRDVVITYLDYGCSMKGFSYSKNVNE